MKQIQPNKTNIQNDQTAFTIIEVMLYLAIAGLVIIIGMNAFSGRTAQVQFTDSMRSLSGFVNSQYSEFVSGVLPYDTNCAYESSTTRTPTIGNPSVPSDGSCILFGKVFIFETGNNSDIAREYNLVGRSLTEDEYGDDPNCNKQDLRCVDAYVIDFNSPGEYQILWGTRFVKGNERNHSLFGNGGHPIDDAPQNQKNDNSRGFGWLKEPTTNRVIPIVFGMDPLVGVFNAGQLQNPNIYVSHEKSIKQLSQVPRAAINDEFNTAFCFQGANGQMAMLLFGEGESQEVVNLTFGEENMSHDCGA